MHSNMLLHMHIDAVVELVLSTYVERVGLGTLLQLAGQNFFALYLLCALGYVALQRTLQLTPTGWINGWVHPEREEKFPLSGQINTMISSN